MRKTSPGLAAVLAGLLFFAPLADAEPDATADEPTRLLVRTAGRPASEVVDRVSSMDETGSVRSTGRGWLIVTPGASSSAASLAARLRELPAVASVHADVKATFPADPAIEPRSLRPAASPSASASASASASRQGMARNSDGEGLPDDPLFPNQWHLRNVGQFWGRPGVDVAAPAVWPTTTGDPEAIIVYIGAGVSTRHEDLVDNLWTNPGEIPDNGLDDDDNGYVDDVHGINTWYVNGDTEDLYGAGTAVAGIAAARGNNGIGTTGVAWQSRILSCRITSDEGQFWYGGPLLCVDYVLALKDRGANIAAVVFGFGVPLPNTPIRVAAELLAEADVPLVAAVLPSGYNLAEVPDYPALYLLPNVLAVTSAGRNGGLELGMGFGPRVVHVKLPGHDILTPYPGKVPTVRETPVYEEDFEDDDHGWTAGAAWQLTGEVPYSGQRSWAIGETKSEDEDVARTLTSPTIDLSALRGQRVGINLRLYYPHREQEHGFRDILHLRYELWHPEAGTWGFVTLGLDPTEVWQDHYIEIPEGYWEGWHPFTNNNPTIPTDGSGFRLRIKIAGVERLFRLLHVDDVAIGPARTGTLDNNYELYNGTVAAAGVAAGMIALMRSQRPDLSAAEIRNLFVASATREIAGAEMFPIYQLMTPYMPHLLGAGGGTLDCSGRPYARRVLPRKDQDLFRVRGQALPLRVLNIDCANPGPPPRVVDGLTGRSLRLHDDGRPPHDETAGDGMFALDWRAGKLGTHPVTVEDENPLYVHWLDAYGAPEEVPFAWREIDGQRIDRRMAPPFPLRLGDHPEGISNEVTIRDGKIILFRLRDFDAGASGLAAKPAGDDRRRGNVTETNQIPHPGDQYVIAPLLAQFGGSDRSVPRSSPIYHAVRHGPYGREWVVEWRDLGYEPCPDSPGLHFQVVFFEQLPDILFNYRRAGEACAEHTLPLHVGLQANELSWQRYRGELRSGVSLRFRPDAGPNEAPEPVEAAPAVVLRHGVRVDVDLSRFFRDPDGDRLEYAVDFLPGELRLSGNGRLSGWLRLDDLIWGSPMTVRLIASDGRLGTALPVELWLDPGKNRGPAATERPAVLEATANHVTRWPLDEFFVDLDRDTLYYTAENPPDFLDLYSVTASLVAKPSNRDVNGSPYAFDITATDGSESVTRRFEARVGRGGNQAPRLMRPLSELETQVGEYTYFDYGARFEDANEDYIRFRAEGLPEGLYGNDGVIRGAPEDGTELESPYLVTITASDDAKVTTVQLRLTVAPAGRPPEANGSQLLNFRIDESVTLDVSGWFEEPDGQPLAFEIVGLPPGLEDNGRGLITGRVASAGTRRVQVIARDTDGQSATVRADLVFKAASGSGSGSGGGASAGSGGGGGGSVGALWLALLWPAWRRHRQRHRPPATSQ